jgi:hypothetical protein
MLTSTRETLCYSEKLKEKKRMLDWHAAFFAALQAELVDYLDILQFEKEHPLNQKPLQIDAIVIKAPPDAVIKKNFARGFKGHNILEYKSPRESLTVSAYIKTVGYACLYQAIENIDPQDITITIVCTTHPQALLEHLKKQDRRTIVKTQEGIYQIEGEMFPVQIAVGSRLSPDDNTWFATLKEKLSRESLEKTMQKNSAVKNRINLSAFWHVYKW